MLGEEEARTFAAAYDITGEGNFEGRSIPNRLADPTPIPPAQEARLAEIRARLLEARGARIRPGLDNKVLADWNGLAIAALARASGALKKPEWLAMAERAYRFVCESMSHGDRLAHSRLGERSVFPGLSGDYAAMIGAALAMNETTGQAHYVHDACRWAESLDRWHHDTENGGYFLAASDASDIRIRLRQGNDDPVPNPNALIAQGLVRLWHLTGEDRYRNRADRLFRAYAAEIGEIRSPMPGSSQPSISASRQCRSSWSEKTAIPTGPPSHRPRKPYRTRIGSSWSSPRGQVCRPPTRPTQRDRSMAGRRHMSASEKPARYPLRTRMDCGRSLVARSARASPIKSGRDQVFMKSKNSLFDLVCFSLSRRNSIASTVPIGFRIRRST